MERERSRSRRADSHKSFYDTKRWHVARRAYLFNHPLCERCEAIAEHVHHDPPLHVLLATGRNPYDPAVLRSLCKPCHSSETRAEQGGNRLGPRLPR
jgi:5-methylcytosine-specific restriction enzyme A